MTKLGPFTSLASLGLFASLTACDLAMPPVCQVPESQSPDVIRARESGEVLLNPETLPGLLFDGNVPIHIATNRVHSAKAEVNRARAELLPSLNLTALVFAAGQPQFAWSAVEAAVPFLIPGNWFRAGQAKGFFEAEKLALQIVEQNQYASALSTINLWQIDQGLLSIVEDQLSEAQTKRARTQRAYELGVATLDELNRAIAEEQLSEVSTAKVRAMVAQEEASIRRSLGLKPTAILRSDSASLRSDESASEHLPNDELVSRAIEMTPESRQLKQLEEASQQGRWSSIFAFIGGANLSRASADGSLTASLDELSVRGGIRFSFGYFPALEISNRNIREIQLRQEELRLEFQELFQRLQAQLSAARVDGVRLEEREKAVRSQYENTKLRVELGLAEGWELDRAMTLWQESRLDSLRAQAELGLVRLSWQRALQEGAFEKLSPCLSDFEKKKK